MADTTFVHSPLDLASRQIRLLEVLPTVPRGIIRCTLKTYNIDNADDHKALPYQALSYTWGSPFFDLDTYIYGLAYTSDKEIAINGKIQYVGESLWNFLLVAQSTLCHLPLWIDALCIDQENVDEKNHQLPLMTDIYRNARSVLAWLGPCYCASDKAIQTIRYLAEQGVTGPNRWSKDIALAGWDLYSLQGAVNHFLCRPYWDRLWVVQEVGLARSVTLLCGTSQLQWDTLQDFARDEIEHCKDLGSDYEPMFPRTLLLLLAIKQAGSIDWHSSMVDPGGPGYSESLISLPSWHLSRLVYLFCHFKCADPRDRVYALLGLAKNSELKANNIVADYAKTAKQVFWDFFTYCVTEVREVSPMTYLGQQTDLNAFGVRLMKQMDIHSSRGEEEIKSYVFEALRTTGSPKTL